MVSKRHPAIIGVASVSLVVVLICGGVVVGGRRAFQVGYHRWQMQRVHQAYLEPKTISDGFVVVHVPSDAAGRYEYHRQKLVELGGIVERHYVFEHLRAATDESKHFTKLLVSRGCPNHIDFESPYPDKPQPMQLTVWCWPADAGAWDAFVVSHDIPNYHERFVREN